jgi:hypothetical protein
MCGERPSCLVLRTVSEASHDSGKSLGSVVLAEGGGHGVSAGKHSHGDYHSGGDYGAQGSVTNYETQGTTENYEQMGSPNLRNVYALSSENSYSAANNSDYSSAQKASQEYLKAA